MNPNSFTEVTVSSILELNEWFSQNYASDQSFWLVTYKKETINKYISREDVLDVLIAYGWIDGIRKKREDDKTMQLICKRKNNIWAKTYKDRASKLIEAGKMQPSGFAAIDYSKQNNLWDAMNDVDEFIIPPDLEKALIHQFSSIESFEKYAPSYRRNILRWLRTAKGEATRNKRIAMIVDYTTRLEKIPNY